MKIIYLVHARIPTEKAHGVQIMKMCEALADQIKIKKNGFTPDSKVELVVANRYNPDFKGIDSFDFYSIKENFTIRRLLVINFLCYRIPFAFIFELVLFSLIAFFYLLFQNGRIVVYTRGETLPFLKFLPKRFSIFWETHIMPKNFNRYRKILLKTKGAVVVTKHYYEELIKNNVFLPDKVLLAPDAVNMEQFSIKDSKTDIRKRFGLDNDKKIVLYTGKLSEWKGVYVLLKASKYLPSNIVVIFIGGMEESIRDFRATSNKLNTKNALILGYKPPKEIPYWLKAADILVLPNSGKGRISNFYTSPLKLFEYMASKRPIIASDLPCLRDILNKNNAVLVEPDNPKALAKSIEITLKKPDFCAKISGRAFKDVKKYSWQNRAGEVIRFIKRNL
ncbi:MAG: glycosyltransferase family 4 protein [bacterium]